MSFTHLHLHALNYKHYPEHVHHPEADLGNSFRYFGGRGSVVQPKAGQAIIHGCHGSLSIKLNTSRAIDASVPNHHKVHVGPCQQDKFVM